jgi:hypothetical protein
MGSGRTKPKESSSWDLEEQNPRNPVRGTWKNKTQGSQLSGSGRKSMELDSEFG